MIRPHAPRTAMLAVLVFLGNASIAELWAQSNPPWRCSGYGDLQSISLTDWENGLSSWTADSREIANPATFDTDDWAVVGNLPDGRDGSAAFVANLDAGDCAADDQAGALYLDSPSIVIPGSAAVPRISIQHWFNIEPDWDGGNLKISVNGGPFAIVPEAAIEYGPYTGTLLPALDEFGVEFNTNPLAGERAFTGTHDGLSDGDWIETRINLLGIAESGDSIRLRFDFGVDSCGGEIGWYVDEVEVYSCLAELPPSDCGNGVLDAGEQCDDGNDFIGDGCSSSCQVEAGWVCEDPTEPADLKDPSFEDGSPNAFWQEVSDNPLGTPICNQATCGAGGSASDGDYWAWFGGVPDGSEGSVAQTVTIPEGVSELSFDLEVPSCDSASDYLEVLIDGNREYLVNGSSSLCGEDGYTRQSVDVSAYADNFAHELELHSETIAMNGSASSFFVDLLAMPGTPSICTENQATTSLTLQKVVVNDDDGTAAPSAWTLHADGPTPFSGPGPSVTSGSGFQPGTYNLSETGGPSGYTASDWDCDGGTQSDADTIVLAAGESATCTITNDDFDSSFPINAGHSGAWYDPETSGQGFFIDIEPASQFMFISWFTYTDDESGNPFQQRWFTAQGEYAGSRAELVLSETLGGEFNGPLAPTTKEVGTVTLNFANCEQAALAYDIVSESLEGSIPLVRVVPGSGNVCADLAGNSTQAVDINAGMDGAWFDPETSGQGFFIDAHSNPQGPDFLFLSWFTYGDATASGQRWFTAQGQFEGGSSATINLNQTTGGSFNSSMPTPNTEGVGSMTLEFEDCNNATFSFVIDGENLEGDIPVTRVVPGGDTLCEALSGAE